MAVRLWWDENANIHMEEIVNLREALSDPILPNADFVSVPAERLRIIVAAAKRELAREERERPKRFPLDELEQLLRIMARNPPGDAVELPWMIQVADVVLQLRKQVIPWLRMLASAPECTNARDTRELRPGWEHRRCSCCHRLVLHEGGILPEQILEWLGEPR